MKVKLLRPIYPYKSGDIIEMNEKKYEYFKNQAEKVVEKKQIKKKQIKKKQIKKKQIKKWKNKAILKNKNTKW